MKIRPLTGRTNPATARNAVVLAEPEGPISGMISPGSTERLNDSMTSMPTVGDANLVEHDAAGGPGGGHRLRQSCRRVCYRRRAGNYFRRRAYILKDRPGCHRLPVSWCQHATSCCNPLSTWSQSGAYTERRSSGRAVSCKFHPSAARPAEQEIPARSCSPALGRLG